MLRHVGFFVLFFEEIRETRLVGPRALERRLLLKMQTRV